MAGRPGVADTEGRTDGATDGVHEAVPPEEEEKVGRVRDALVVGPGGPTVGLTHSLPRDGRGTLEGGHGTGEETDRSLDVWDGW